MVKFYGGGQFESSDRALRVLSQVTYFKRFWLSKIAGFVYFATNETLSTVALGLSEIECKTAQS